LPASFWRSILSRLAWMFAYKPGLVAIRFPFAQLIVAFA
jgi:hypothetical protein